MKLLEAFQVLHSLEQADRPNLGRTKVSMDSDNLIDEMEEALAVFIAIYLSRGYFTQNELNDLDKLFKKHTQDQYFLGQNYTDKKTGEAEPISHADLEAINRLANEAKTDFLNSLAKKQKDDIATHAGIIAGLAAAVIGIKALNQGTVSHARLVEFVTRRDNRVCPICEALDGNIYEVDSVTKIIKNGPVIPDDTHPNCRCRYLIVP